MFDLENKEVLVAPDRIQNIALFVSLLVDRYEANNDINSLELASSFAELVIKTQDKSGAYLNKGVHYTCVIYVAKSLLELYDAEKNLSGVWKKRAEKHFLSVTRAIDEICKNPDLIGTEGEHTLEDGMITCGALQVALYALHLPKDKRKTYTDTAEYLLGIHKCLEQEYVPDCRQRGATLRFWEAQYDVLIDANMMSSPHGWTAWICYAEYYLYLLTQKEEYLISFMNTISACAQLIDKSGNLRWAFMSDPCVTALCSVPDEKNEIEDGLTCVNLKTKAYRAKQELFTLNEGYIDMISSWYRTGEQKVTGGYSWCPIRRKDSVEWVDNQGGCCDNDVHEIFKCIEETVLKKAFVKERENGEFLCYGCSIDENLNVKCRDGIEIVVADTKKDVKVSSKLKQIKL